jgi:uncharacterized iron-regulated membrane protein
VSGEGVVIDGLGILGLVCPGCYTWRMRKRLKKKRRACGLCKPHKRAMSNRWKTKDLALLKKAETEMRTRELEL